MHALGLSGAFDMLIPWQAVGFDGHARGVLSELEGVFQVFEDVTEVR